MGTRKTEGELLVDSIYELFKGKLIHQFRKPKWEKIIEESVNRIVATAIVDVSMAAENRATQTAAEECNKELQNQYNLGKSHAENLYANWIPKPSDGIGTRIKFLFTGKF